MDLVAGSAASTSMAIDKLVSLLTGEENLLEGVEIVEVHSLRQELKHLTHFLEEADDERSEDEEYLKNWSKQIKELAELIEDVVDDYIYEVSQPGFIKFLGKAGRLIGTLNSRRNLASNIQNIKALLLEIKERGQKCKKLSRSRLSRRTTTVERYYPRFVSPLLEKCFVGLDSAVQRLKEEAYGPPVISILDIGETSLVNTVYETEVLKGHFDCHAWITVSHSYDTAKLLKIMAKEVCTAEMEFDSMLMEDLIMTIRQSLLSKRYMLVFHDVWQVEFLQVVKDALPVNEKGSKVIITTRSEKVVASCREISFDHVHKPEPLSEAMCWDLFCGIAFQYERMPRCPPELKQLSLEFIRMCEGSLLAIVAIAELLSKKEKTMSEWKTLLDNFSSEVESKFHLTGAPKILSLCFLALPHQLKLCFLYFSIFPKDSLIPNEKLYKLWIAEGFVQEKRGKTSEVVAEECLNELIRRNLVQACEGFYGLEKFCRVHSLIHDIARQKADEFRFCRIWDGNNSSARGKSHRISVCNHAVANVLETIEDSQVRSVFLFRIGTLGKSFLVTMFERYKLLTMLDFENVPLEHLPSEVGNLYLLNYLNLKNTKVKRLPKSIGKLQNLQTLDVRNTLLIELPLEINRLQNLRHLTAGGYVNTISLDSAYGVRVKEGIGRLENLQTLMTVEATHLTGIGLVKELDKLRRLRRLGISRLTAEVANALCPCIEEMSHLECLSLDSTSNQELLDLHTISSPSRFLQRLILKGILRTMPHWILSLQNLTMLYLSFSRLTYDPLDSLCHLPNLVSLWLYKAYGGEQLHFEEGGFPRLKLLVLRELQELKVVEVEEGALPHLEELRIGSSPLLNEVPSGIQHLRNLKVLANYDMPNDFVLSMQPNGGAEYWKVEHVQCVIFWYRTEGSHYMLYKLGEPELLDHLQGLATDTNDATQRDTRLSFYCSDDEEDSVSTWKDINRSGFSTPQGSFFSDDIED